MSSDQDRREARQQLIDLIDDEIAVDAVIANVETVAKAAGWNVSIIRDGRRDEMERTLITSRWRKVEREYPDVSGGGVPYPPREV